MHTLQFLGWMILSLSGGLTIGWVAAKVKNRIEAKQSIDK